MKKTLLSSALLFATATSTSAIAQMPQRDFRNDEGAYVGGAFGAFGARATGINLKDGPSSMSKNGSGGKLFAGYQFTEILGAEIGGIRSSTLKRAFVVNDSNVTQKGDVTAFYFAGTARVPIGERFAVNARLGIARSKFSGTNALPVASAITGSNSGILFGVGGEYRITPKIAAAFDYDYLAKTSKHLKSGLISVGFKFAF